MLNESALRSERDAKCRSCESGPALRRGSKKARQQRAYENTIDDKPPSPEREEHEQAHICPRPKRCAERDAERAEMKSPHQEKFRSDVHRDGEECGADRRR